MAMSDIMSNFAGGYRIGSGIGEGIANKRTASALSDLQAYQSGGLNLPDQQAAQPGEEGDTGVPANPKLPSTRDWITLRAQYLQAAAKQGPEALAAAHQQVDDMQRRGFTESLMTAKSLMQQGRQEEAAKYLELGASYRPDFSVLVTSPATMDDGSTGIAGYLQDEQTGEPRTPGMMMTEDMIDYWLSYGADPLKFAEGAWDRRLAEEMAGLKGENLAWERGYKMQEAERKREATQMQYGPKSAQRYKPSDYRTELKNILDAYNEQLAMTSGTGAGLPASVRAEAAQKMQEVIDAAPGVAPATAISVVMKALAAENKIPPME